VPRWRPIQSFIALTDNLQPESGGFECVKGFHHEFASWAATRPPSTPPPPAEPIPAPCVGDFTPIRPLEDAGVISRFEPVLYQAGSVVAWDYRCEASRSPFSTDP
jgi:hypothetical protein